MVCAIIFAFMLKKFKTNFSSLLEIIIKFENPFSGDFDPADKKLPVIL
jgi:hypothetical protein